MKSPHMESMLKASGLKKGFFRDKVDEVWRVVMLTMDHATQFDPVYIDDGSVRFSFLYYDPTDEFNHRLHNDTRNRRRRARRNRHLPSRPDSRQLLEQHPLPLKNTPSYARRSLDGPVRHTAPIPVCATAGAFCHGICAPCYLLGGTLAERLARCSVSKMLTPEEYQEMDRPGVTGLVGPADRVEFSWNDGVPLVDCRYWAIALTAWSEIQKENTKCILFALSALPAALCAPQQTHAGFGRKKPGWPRATPRTKNQPQYLWHSQIPTIHALDNCQLGYHAA